MIVKLAIYIFIIIASFSLAEHLWIAAGAGFIWIIVLTFLNETEEKK